MKKILFITCFLLHHFFACAQNLSFGPFVSAGYSWLSVSEDDGADTKFHFAYAIGGKLIYSFVNHWGINIALNYSSEGGSMLSSIGGEEHKYIYRANYIRVPLEGIYFFGALGDKVRPRISIGPSLGFFLSGKSRLKVNGEETVEVDSKEVFTGFDIGLSTSAGLNFRLKKNKWLNTGITYYHGFTNIFENSGDVNIRNRSLSINIGLTFPLGTVRQE